MFIFPILFPLMAIIGTYLMNTTQNNVILLIDVIFNSIIYSFNSHFLKIEIHEAIYPFSIW